MKKKTIIRNCLLGMLLVFTVTGCGKSNDDIAMEPLASASQAESIADVSEVHLSESEAAESISEESVAEEVSVAEEAESAPERISSGYKEEITDAGDTLVYLYENDELTYTEDTELRGQAAQAMQVMYEFGKTTFNLSEDTEDYSETLYDVMFTEANYEDYFVGNFYPCLTGSHTISNVTAIELPLIICIKDAWVDADENPYDTYLAVGLLDIEVTESDMLEAGNYKVHVMFAVDRLVDGSYRVERVEYDSIYSATAYMPNTVENMNAEITEDPLIILDFSNTENFWSANASEISESTDVASEEGAEEIAESAEEQSEE